MFRCNVFTTPYKFQGRCVYQDSALEVAHAVKICPKFWVPGTPPNALWTNVQAKFCFECDECLQNRCNSCNELITSLKYRFCPYCGQVYKFTKSETLKPEKHY